MSRKGKTKEFPIWKTIKTGTGLKTGNDFIQALTSNGFKVSDWARDILGKPAFTAASKKTELDLVKVTARELGFSQDARRDAIYQRAQKLGLQLCPAEVGLQLRLQYQDQPNGEWLLVAMDPILDSDGHLNVFRVERRVFGLWLDARSGSPGRVWSPDAQWVFVRPRK